MRTTVVLLGPVFGELCFHRCLRIYGTDRISRHVGLVKHYLYGHNSPMNQTVKRGRGRPRLEEPEDSRLEIRLSKRRRKAYDDAAARRGLPTGTWAKAVLDRASKR